MITIVFIINLIIYQPERKHKKMTEQEEIAFEDWEAEFQQTQGIIIEGQPSSQSLPHIQQLQQKSSTLQEEKKLSCVDRLRHMTDSEFKLKCKDKKQSERLIGLSPSLLRTQKDFVELSKTVADRFRQKAEKQQQKVVPQNQIVLFFQEMLLYLYPKYGWENVEYAKEKLKIVKKDRKEDEIRARKIKEKQERMRRIKEKDIETAKDEIKQKIQQNCSISKSSQSVKEQQM